jgi:hypothetical protein
MTLMKDSRPWSVFRHIFECLRDLEESMAESEGF